MESEVAKALSTSTASLPLFSQGVGVSTNDSAYSLDLNLPVAIVLSFKGVHLEW